MLHSEYAVSPPPITETSTTTTVPPYRPADRHPDTGAAADVVGLTLVGTGCVLAAAAILRTVRYRRAWR